MAKPTTHTPRNMVKAIKIHSQKPSVNLGGLAQHLPQHFLLLSPLPAQQSSMPHDQQVQLMTEIIPNPRIGTRKGMSSIKYAINEGIKSAGSDRNLDASIPVVVLQRLM